MALYPNPASNTLNINFMEPVIINQVQIFDTNGKVVMNSGFARKVENNGSISLPDLNLPNGTYMVRVISSDGDVFADKFIIEK